MSGCDLAEIGAWEDGASMEEMGASESLTVDRWKELLIVDPAVLNEGSDNATDGAPFSFRSQMEWLAGSPERAAALVDTWLEQWIHLDEVGEARVPLAPRPGARPVLLDPWRALTADGVDGSPLRLEAAPFRLIAIVNRLDLAEDPCVAEGGELRYVYAAVHAWHRTPLDMTVIIEIPYPETRNAADWARAWNLLASEPAETYASALANLTRTIQTHVDAARARVRTNERAFAPEQGWELREFHLLETGTSAPALVQVPLTQTPRSDVSTKLLAKHLERHGEEILLGEFTLPNELRAAAALLRKPDFVWDLDGLDADVSRALSARTCNGCHGGETEALPFQHIAPAATDEEPARLSRFLNDPEGGPDDLGRRAARTREFLDVECAPVPSVYP